MSDKADRYQHQPWHIKLWRRRHYIPIPLVALSIYLKGRKVRRHDPPSLRIAWSIAIGLAQVKMNWLHDYSELRERLERKLAERKLAERKGDPNGAS